LFSDAACSCTGKKILRFQGQKTHFRTFQDISGS
jgi:hypothetical protein